ncbi:MAG: hypothetical protein K5644_09370 [Lachnospiraceae bacterium]|nr:hypothetical protein [Lachnospiraceae bacterium]
MEYSIGKVGSGFSEVKPLSYGLSNQSVTSTSFAESLQNVGGADSVGLVTPTQYPNARVVSPIEKAQESIKVAKAFNDVAEGLQGITNGYNNKSQGTDYSLVGATVDVYV